MCIRDRYSLDKITLDVNAPWLHESFHANRRRADTTGEMNHQWHLDVPIVSEGKLFGKVEVLASPHCGFTHHQIISELLQVIALVEGALVEDKTAAPSSAEVSIEETGSEPVESS